MISSLYTLEVVFCKGLQTKIIFVIGEQICSVLINFEQLNTESRI